MEETVALLIESTVAFAFTIVFGSFYLWLTSDVVRDLLIEKRDQRHSRVAAFILRHAYKAQVGYKVPDKFVVK